MNVIQLKKERLSVKEIYKKCLLHLNILPSELKEFDNQLSNEEKVQYRIESYQEILNEQKINHWQQELHDLIHSIEEEDIAHLMSKEYAKFATLVVEEEAKELQEEVEQVKAEEDGHSKMPLQMMQIMQSDN